MKKKLTTLLFGLLLAVGWTNDASAQKLPDRTLAEEFTAFDHSLQNEYLPDVDAVEGLVDPSHSAMVVKKAKKSTAGNRLNAPMRAGQELEMKSLTLAEAEALTYTWTDASNQQHTSNAAEVAKDPNQMYELLKFVYTDKRFPGAYYSAYTKDDQRERKVYYGAVDGGWDITGPTVSNPTSTFIRNSYSTVSTSLTVADGSATPAGYNFIPVYGYYWETAQTTQTIYTAAELSQQGLKVGDQITSLSYYPTSTSLPFSGGNVTVSLGTTTTSEFTSNSALDVSVTQVAQVTSYSLSNGRWTINFDQPFTYTGNNLLVQIGHTSGNYGTAQTYFYGTEPSQSTYRSYTNYSGGTRYTFVPKATFGYTTQVISGTEEVTYNPAVQYGDITITGSTGNNIIYSITVKSGNYTLFSWDYANDGDAGSSGSHWPTGMHLDYWSVWSRQSVPFAIGFTTHDGSIVPITLDDWLFMGYDSNLTVTISAQSNSSSNYGTISVNGDEKNINSTTQTDYTWTLRSGDYTHSYTKYDPDYYKPNQEGYTALIVAVKNQTSHGSSSSTYDGSYFTTKEEIVNYLANNVDSIQLLTDGIRIGAGSDYSIGTVFNTSGTYNKFFFLGKGQAKQKPDVVVNKEIAMGHALGELAPFKCMFEQFSPTTGEVGAQTDNFYSKMMEGNVYNVVHDCRDVIWLGHQFSMSGNEGEKPYAMTGLNFFIPDYRLKYWEDILTYRSVDYTVDGRITNQYQEVSADGNPALNPSLMLYDASMHSFWYAWYNQDYAPKVGLYKITLDAVATPVAYDHTEGNLNYAVTLTWVSSLNEMSGHNVPQIYTVYYWDPVTGEKKYVQALGITDGKTGLTTVTYLVEQKPHSYKIEYIVEGTPDDGQVHPQFVAVSNLDDVIIPGWEDFIGLDLDHHESDFVVDDMGNYYRNFLVVLNEDIANGLTIDQITDPENPMNEFKLYRFEFDANSNRKNEVPVAILKFKNPTAEQVEYEITYVNTQKQYEPDGDEHKYDLDENHMDVPLTGIIRIKGNGDIVIWPNGYHVNFKSIVIKDNGVAIPGYSWNADNDNTLPNGWSLSTGSVWKEYVLSTNDDMVGYVEGGGYIYIPNMLNNSNYTNLTVEIVAYGDGANVTRIAVNDKTQTISNTTGTTYTWGGLETPLSPNAAPRRDNPNNNVPNNNTNN